MCFYQYIIILKMIILQTHIKLFFIFVEIQKNEYGTAK